MAVAVSAQTIVNTGPLRLVHATVTFDSSYPTGGETLTPSDFGLSSIVGGVFDNGGGYAYEVVSGPKLKAYYGDNTNASRSAFYEVPNTTDLSAVACKGLVFGH